MPSDHIPHPEAADDRNKEVIYMRIPLDLLAKVDAHRAELQRSALSGVEISRAAAIRNLLELAIATKVPA